MLGKLSIRIDKEFVYGYRNYKIDLINGKSVKDIRYMVFQEILENSKFKLSDIIYKK